MYLFVFDMYVHICMYEKKPFSQKSVFIVSDVSRNMKIPFPFNPILFSESLVLDKDPVLTSLTLWSLTLSSTHWLGFHRIITRITRIKYLDPWFKSFERYNINRGKVISFKRKEKKTKYFLVFFFASFFLCFSFVYTYSHHFCVHSNEYIHLYTRTVSHTNKNSLPSRLE